MSEPTRGPDAGHTRLLALVLGPAVAGAVLAVITLAGIWSPARNPMRQPPPADAGSVMANNGPEVAASALRQGLSPNAVVAFRHPRLTANRDTRLSLLVIATAAGNENTAMMLLSAGAEPAHLENQGAACLAEWNGLAALASSIRRGGGGPAACPPRPADGALAMPFAATTDR